MNTKDRDKGTPSRRTFFIVLVQGLFDFGQFAISDQGFVLFHLGNAPRQFDFQIVLDRVTVGVRSTNFIPQGSHGRHCLGNQFVDGERGVGEGGHCWSCIIAGIRHVKDGFSRRWLKILALPCQLFEDKSR